MLYATVRQRKIHIKNPTTVIQNGIGVDKLMLSMDEEWLDMDSIVCVFTTKYMVEEEKKEEETEEEQAAATDQEGESAEEEPTTVMVEKEIVKEMLLTFGEPVLVPWENLTETGTLSVSCTGYVGGEKVMTTMMPDSFWTIVQNGPVTGEKPMEATPSLYEQVLAAAGDANKAAKIANKVSTELRIAAENGKFNGISPTITLGTVSSGTEVKITNSGTPQNAVFNFVLPRGPQGKDGKDGKDGEPGKAGYDGKDGAPGKDGANGLPGQDGKNGKDGVSPTINVSNITGGYRVSITDAESTKTIDLLNGKDGKNGIDGKDGIATKEGIIEALGYTPMGAAGGMDGQFAISDGQGGIRWVSLINVGEVGA